MDGLLQAVSSPDPVCACARPEPGARRLRDGQQGLRRWRAPAQQATTALRQQGAPAPSAPTTDVGAAHGHAGAALPRPPLGDQGLSWEMNNWGWGCKEHAGGRRGLP